MLSDVTSHVAWLKRKVQLLLKPHGNVSTRAKHAITSGNAVCISNSFCYLTFKQFPSQTIDIMACGKVKPTLPWQNLGGLGKIWGPVPPWPQRRTATEWRSLSWSVVTCVYQSISHTTSYRLWIVTFALGCTVDPQVTIHSVYRRQTDRQTDASLSHKRDRYTVG